VSLRLYMDVNVAYPIAVALRLRGIDVLTAQEDGAREFDDAALLERAASLGRVLVTHDDDLLREAARRQQRDLPFAGLIYAHQLAVTIGQCVDDLELIAQVDDPVNWVSRVQYLPLK
jgi:predicted nuclease of predicted toxin-antitoxin system